MMKSRVFQAAKSEGGLSVQIVVVVLDEGIVVTLGGGDVSHVGAVALAEPRPSRRDPRKMSSSVSVFARLGHKEDDLAKKLAGQLAAMTGLPVVLSAGIHVEAASEDEIMGAQLMAKSLVEDSVPQIEALLKGGS
jgi:hypothetical protein